MSSKESVIKGVPLFARCSKGELELVARLSDQVDFPEGAALMREGETGREFFIIVSGTASVTRDGVELGTVGPGEFCGELALIERVPRTATVTATSPVEALVLTGQAFSGLRHELPNVDSSVLAELQAHLDSDAASSG